MLMLIDESKNLNRWEEPVVVVSMLKALGLIPHTLKSIFFKTLPSKNQQVLSLLLLSETDKKANECRSVKNT